MARFANSPNVQNGPDVENATDVENMPVEDRPAMQFSLQTVLALNTAIGILLSIPFLGLTAAILFCLFVLQLPLFLLFGAFRLTAADLEEPAEINYYLPRDQRAPLA